MIKCCGEHVELAIDVVVDTYETPPKIDKIDDENLSTSCEYCRNAATYVVSN